MAKSKKEKQTLPAIPEEPPKWTPTADLLEHVVTLGALGLTEKQAADRIGHSLDQFMENPELENFKKFQKAIDKGRANGIARVSKALFEKALKGDFQAMKLYLTCVAKWAPAAKDEPTVENNNTQVIVYVPKPMNIQEWTQFADESSGNEEVKDEELKAAPPALKAWAQEAANKIVDAEVKDVTDNNQT